MAVTRLAVAGELTIFTAAAVRDQLLTAFDAGGDVEVDLSAVGELDSAGLQVMVAAKREAARRDRALRFTGHSAAVVATLDLCDLSAHLGDPVLIPRGEAA